MILARHAVRLVGDVAAFAGINRAWWLLLVLPIVVLAVASIGSATVVVPYTVYTFF